ncbi:helix-turn-helix domain-containing protein [Portibacter marinus]|uniref:helix-turn-helix domain-containing protein n=1 Tax=Portibacter marinus TaxID=2898660 RepID=UPI001F29DBFE|nr:helix-turn-helix transcriptional regulator [Portibacter marinus]
MVKKKKNIPKPTNFGANLKFLRRLNGISQGGFAERIGISRNSIASYENGMVEPNAENFLKICEYFGEKPLSMMVEDLSVRSNGQSKNKPNNLKKYVFESFSEFLSQTNEITKVFEGYSAFYEMRKTNSDSEDHKELYMILDDLFVLLKSLIKENWNLIQNVYPHYASDELTDEEAAELD